MIEPEAVLAAIPHPQIASLADGLAGTALLHACLSHVDPVFAAAADRHWAAAARHERRHRAQSAGVFTTAGGLATSLIIGAAYLPDPAARQEHLAQATTWLSQRARRIADDLAQRHRAGAPYTHRADYDTINGLAGIGRVLLAAVTGHQPAGEPGLLAALQALTTMITTPHGSRPGWWLPAALHPSPELTDPSGSAVTGMAHGIAGPLAVLATASARGWTVPGQDDATRYASQWLLDWRADGTYRWPTSISGTELDAGAAQLSGRQDAWCYGTPGISAALAHAGRVLGDDTLTRLSDSALASLSSRSAHSCDTGGPTLCHGHAGVLQCAADRHPGLADAAANAVSAAVDLGRPFAIPNSDNGTLTNDPGFLTGAAGAALSLADHGGLLGPAVPDRWDSILLLS
jgi:hypothetical protein